MNSISLEEAHHYLSNCRGILLEGRYIKPTVFDIKGDYDHSWLSLAWEEPEEPEECVVYLNFLEGDNQTVLIEDSKLTIITEDGDEEEIFLLREWNPINT